MKECSKSISRRLADANFANKYFVGSGIDIGGKPDPLILYKELFPRIIEIKTWDLEDGDAQKMPGVAEETYNFAHSSHCLEHLTDPIQGLQNWFKIIKQGGYLVVSVPDEDLYEQGVFPSTFNKDHKWTFTVYKQRSWSEKSINVMEMLMQLGEAAEVLRIEQLSTTYRFDLPRYDQTLTPVGECGIEFVVRKRLSEEVLDRGRWRRPTAQPSCEMRLHLNQYKNDLAVLKEGNRGAPPFNDDRPIE